MDQADEKDGWVTKL